VRKELQHKIFIHKVRWVIIKEQALMEFSLAVPNKSSQMVVVQRMAMAAVEI
jgi:hypothetical protein